MTPILAGCGDGLSLELPQQTFLGGPHKHGSRLKLMAVAAILKRTLRIKMFERKVVLLLFGRVHVTWKKHSKAMIAVYTYSDFPSAISGYKFQGSTPQNRQVENMAGLLDHVATKNQGHIYPNSPSRLSGVRCHLGCNTAQLVSLQL